MLRARPVGRAVVVPMVVVMAAQQPHGPGIHRQAQDRDRNGFAKRDRRWRDQAADGFGADHQRDHREHDRRGEPGEIPELPGSKGEPGVGGVKPGVAIGQGGQQQRAGMRGHVHPIRDQRDGAVSEAAHDLQRHHRAAQGDHRPTAPFRMVVVVTEKHVAVSGGLRHRLGIGHGGVPFASACRR